MPGMTGIELGTKLTLERPDIRVMLMSGFTSGMLVLNSGWQFLSKPFVPSQLRESILNVLASPSSVNAPDIDERKE
jgi:FixJ family two-component response regulator